MKTRNLTFLHTTMAVLAFSVATASAVRKNEPDEDDVEEILQELGGVHWQENMDINEVGSVEVENPVTGEEDYFHVFSGVAEQRYRIIIFDNTPQYLGYYPSNYEPVEYEEGAVLLDAGDGESYFSIPVPPEGPPEKIRIDLTPTTFVRNENVELDKTADATNQRGYSRKTGEEEPVHEYRDWTLIVSGQEYNFNAIFVRRDHDRIYLKEAKRGLVNDFPASAFSKADKEYLIESGIFK